MSQANCITRRQMLQRSAGSLLAAGLWPGALRAEGLASGDDFHFLVVNDLHYIDKGCVKWLEGVVQKMKGHAEKIDFCLVVGDLVEDGKPEQLAPVRDLLNELALPVHVVIGNHDYLSQTDRKPYEELFPKSINYHFEHGGWQFVGLDSSDGVRYTKIAVQPATLRWLDETLPQLDRKRPMIVFTHFPLGPRVTYRPTNAEDVLGLFKEYNLRAVFNGHFHGFTERTLGDTIVTTNRCCAFRRDNHDGTKEKGYFVCRARDGKIERTFVQVN